MAKLTPENKALQSTKNDAIKRIRETNWCWVSENSGEDALFEDLNRPQGYFNGESFFYACDALKMGDYSDRKNYFPIYIKDLLSAKEHIKQKKAVQLANKFHPKKNNSIENDSFAKLCRVWDQRITYFLSNVISHNIQKASNENLFLSQSYTTNIHHHGTDGSIHLDITYYHMQIKSPEKVICQLPGTISARFILIPIANSKNFQFQFQWINPSNTLLTDLCINEWAAAPAPKKIALSRAEKEKENEKNKVITHFKKIITSKIHQAEQEEKARFQQALTKPNWNIAKILFHEIEVIKRNESLLAAIQEDIRSPAKEGPQGSALLLLNNILTLTTQIMEDPINETVLIALSACYRALSNIKSIQKLTDCMFSIHCNCLQFKEEVFHEKDYENTLKELQQLIQKNKNHHLDVLGSCILAKVKEIKSNQYQFIETTKLTQILHNTLKLIAETPVKTVDMEALNLDNSPNTLHRFKELKTEKRPNKGLFFISQTPIENELNKIIAEIDTLTYKNKVSMKKP